MSRPINETMLWLHSYGPFGIKQKDSWVIVGSGPSATAQALGSISALEGVISLNGVISALTHSDIHFVSHYEDFLVSFPFLDKVDCLFMANPLHVGYRCLPVTAFEMMDIEYWSNWPGKDIRFFEKDTSLESSLVRAHTLYNESTVATAALHLLGRNKVKKVRTIGIDGGVGHSREFDQIFYYSAQFLTNYDKAFREFKKTADTFGISVKTCEPVYA